MITGSIQTRNYEDKTGNKRTAVEVIASGVEFVPKTSGAVTQAAAETFEEIDPGEDIPF